MVICVTSPNLRGKFEKVWTRLNQKLCSPQAGVSGQEGELSPGMDLISPISARYIGEAGVEGR